MSTSTAAQLPPKLLGTAIGFLKQPDVLRAAEVYARWRKEARRSSNYYQHFEYGTHFNWEAPACRDLPVVADAKSFALAMQTAEGDDSISRLSVAICIVFHYTTEDHEWVDDLDGSSDNILSNGKYRTLGGLVHAFIAPSLHKCMGKIHRLDIDAGKSFFEEMSLALRQPAPRLTHCRLTARPDFYTGDIVHISPDLFGGRAPLLRDVSLYRDGDIGEFVLARPVPAFAHAVRLSLQAHSVPHPADLPSFFPSLRHLELASCEWLPFGAHSSPEYLAPGDYENLARQLCTLTLKLRTYHETLLKFWEDFIAAMHAVPTLRLDLIGRGKSFARPLLEHLRDTPGLEVRIHRLALRDSETLARPHKDRRNRPVYELRLRAPSANRERTVQGSRDMVSAFAMYLAVTVVRANITELRIPREFLDTCRELIDRLPSQTALHVQE